MYDEYYEFDAPSPTGLVVPTAPTVRRSSALKVKQLFHRLFSGPTADDETIAAAAAAAAKPQPRSRTSSTSPRPSSDSRRVTEIIVLNPGVVMKPLVLAEVKTAKPVKRVPNGSGLLFKLKVWASRIGIPQARARAVGDRRVDLLE